MSTELKWLLTVTNTIGDPMATHDHVHHIDVEESFTSFGAMILWAKAWFKTSGANRTQKTAGSRKRRRLIKPEYYVTPDIHVYLNFYGDENFSEIYNKDSANGVIQLIRYVKQQGFTWNENFGVNCVDVYSHKHQNPWHWKTLWLNVQGLDEISQSFMEEEEGANESNSYR